VAVGRGKTLDTVGTEEFHEIADKLEMPLADRHTPRNN